MGTLAGLWALEMARYFSLHPVTMVRDLRSGVYTVMVPRPPVGHMGIHEGVPPS